MHCDLRVDGLLESFYILFKSADVEWVQEERVTLFTSDGLIQIGGSMVPRRLTFSDVSILLLLICKSFIVQIFRSDQCFIDQKKWKFELWWYMGLQSYFFVSFMLLCIILVGWRIFLFGQKKQGKSKTSQRFQRFQESDYMDPNQGLCLGALFDIAATNVRNFYAVILS